MLFLIALFTIFCNFLQLFTLFKGIVMQIEIALINDR